MEVTCNEVIGMSDEFKPFSQVSRKKLKCSLKEINKHGKTAGLVLYFILMADADGIAPGDYETIMGVTGLSGATISSHLPRLESLGFIAPADPDPQTAANRYKVSRSWVRFQDTEKKVEVPKGVLTSKVEVPETAVSTSKVEVENNVVSSSDSDPQLIDGSLITAHAQDEKVEVPDLPKLPKGALAVELPTRYADKSAFEVWEAGGGILTHGISERIGGWIDDFAAKGYDGEECTKRAIFEMYRHSPAQKLGYTDSIVKRWCDEPTQKEKRKEAEWNINAGAPKPKPVLTVLPAVSTTDEGDLLALIDQYRTAAPGLAEQLKGATLRRVIDGRALICVKDIHAKTYLYRPRERVARELTAIRKARGASEITAVEFVIDEDLPKTGTEG
jgi:hypothetical protein